MNAALLIKGLISGLPQEERELVEVTHAALKALVDEADKTSEGAGRLALALLGTEMAE